MKSHLLKEPMLHFFVLGLLLYALLDGNGHPVAVENTIIVNDQLVSALKNNFRAQHQRQPSSVEINRLVQTYIEEEALVREAMRLGLEQDDAVVRRRLVQKMHFLFQDLDDEISLKALKQYYLQHPQRYHQAATMDFEQLYFQHNPPTAAAFSAAAHPGDAFALGRQFRQASATAIGKTFGADFYTQLTNLPLQQWQGPLTSAYGFHFVRVKQRQPAMQLAFEAVADAVKADVMQAQRVQKREQGVADSIAKLSVLIDSPLKPLVSPRSVN